MLLAILTACGSESGSASSTGKMTVYNAASASFIEIYPDEMIDCYDCGGTGECTTCGGVGYITIYNYSGNKTGTHNCNMCDDGVCELCGGEGQTTLLEYIKESNAELTPVALIKSGSDDDVYACGTCDGIGLCYRCGGTGVNSSTGSACSSCKSNPGVCKTCGGACTETRAEHNDRLQSNWSRSSGSGSGSSSSGGIKCSYCNGTGKVTCSECDGSGKGEYGRSATLKAFYKGKCILCEGTGEVTCGWCYGQGYE